jgi:hypothetical protein
LRLPPLPPLAPMWRASLQPRDVDGPDKPGHDGYGSANNRRSTNANAIAARFLFLFYQNCAIMRLFSLNRVAEAAAWDVRSE